MYKILLQQFIKQFGRAPSALEKIFLKRQATQKALDQRKVLDMKGNPLDPDKPIIGGTQSEFKSGIMRATGSKPTAVKTEAQIKSGIEAGNKAAVQKMRIDRLRKDVLKEIENRKNKDYIGNIIDPEDYGFRVSDNTWTDEVEELMQMLIRDKKAGGGIAGMLGEPTYQDDNHRVPLRFGKGPIAPKSGPLDWWDLIGDELDPDEWEDILKSVGAYQDGGRVPLKKGKTPWKPPSADENVLEGTWKNMGPWEKVLWGLGLLPFEKGGRVDLAGGGLAAALKIIMQKYGKDAIKLLKDVKPSKKWDTQKAIREFKKRNPQFKAEGGRTGFYLGGPAWKKFMEKLFIKASNDIRQGKGLFKGLTQSQWIKKHDDLIKMLKQWEWGGSKNLPSGMGKKFFDMNDIQIANKFKIATGQIKPSFSLSREKLMNRFPNMTKQQVDELMGKTADEQKEALDQLMKLEKFTTRTKHNAGGPLNTQALIQLYMSEGMSQEEAEAAASASANLPWNILTEKAEGGRVPMWMGGGLGGGKGLLRAIMKHHAETGTTGLTGSKMLQLVNPKQFNEMLNKPEGIPAIAKEMIEKYIKEMKVDRIGAVEHSLGLAKKMKKSKDKLKEMDKITEKLTKEFTDKGMDKKMVKDLVDMFINSKYPDVLKIKALPNITDEAILELENIGKNLATKGRKLNASGGLAGMLGE